MRSWEHPRGKGWLGPHRDRASWGRGSAASREPMETIDRPTARRTERRTRGGSIRARWRSTISRSRSARTARRCISFSNMRTSPPFWLSFVFAVVLGDVVVEGAAGVGHEDGVHRRGLIVALRHLSLELVGRAFRDDPAVVEHDDRVAQALGLV